jgi:hypothetical protein
MMPILNKIRSWLASAPPDAPVPANLWTAEEIVERHGWRSITRHGCGPRQWLVLDEDNRERFLVEQIDMIGSPHCVHEIARGPDGSPAVGRLVGRDYSANGPIHACVNVLFGLHSDRRRAKI